MPNRLRPLDEKVKSVAAALDSINVAAVARQIGVPARTLAYDLEKVRAALPDVVRNRTPGPPPAPKPPAESVRPAPDARPSECPKCHGQRVWKNGGYWVLNWTLMLLAGWLGIQRVWIQRHRCAVCGYEIPSAERQRQAEGRRAWWQQVKRLIGLSRFKLGLSARKTQLLVGFIYARQVSLGFIERQTETIGRCAEAVLQRLKECPQTVARFLMLDETFPKLGGKASRLAVVICEHGLIRGVRCVGNKAKELPALLRDVVGAHFCPEFALTDLEVTYAKQFERAGLDLDHLPEVVHVKRHLIRLFDTAVREVTLDVPKGLSPKQRKKQRRLKQRLLRKQLHPILAVALRALSEGYESVAVLMLEGVVSQLQDPRCVIQTASVQTLARQLARFIRKQGDALNQVLEMAVTDGTPKTTNGLESKNSLFKVFSRVAKYFPLPQRAQAFFAGVALMENFDVKTRGVHKDTSAMQRAGIDLTVLGAHDFFSAVSLGLPQISLNFLTE
ncbi:MAG TPA: hypothetical protein VJ436_04055 [Anaerolineales bacterium]|nr:hypothetical protein [Anaerolineales bacterium]